MVRFLDMAKKVPIPNLEELRDNSQIKTTLMNLRVEEELLKAFKKLCDENLKQPVSKVLRKFMRELCIKNGYLKE